MIICALAFFFPRLTFWPRVNLPQHLLGHPGFEAKEIMTEKERLKLMDLLKEMASVPPYLPSNVEDTKSYKILREDIGEATSPVGNGTCEHPYMVPSLNRSHCILANRIDIGRHYIKTGGVDSMRELYTTSVARLLSFGRYIFNASAFPVVERLFKTESFQSAARTVCPADKQHLDPFQFNFIVQLPGQTVPTHIDGVYFKGATRFQFPQWFLAAMKFSGAFEDVFVNQVQVIAYIHEWQPETRTSGEFVYWNESAAPQWVQPLPRSCVAIDGSKVVHGTAVYRRDVIPPMLDKSKNNILRYLQELDTWELSSDGEVMGVYSTSDLRATLVYRARCFADAEEAEQFISLPESGYFSLASALERLKKVLLERHGIDIDLQRSRPLDTAMALLDNVIRYPLASDVFLPWNYCALAHLIPWTAPLLEPIC